MFGLRGDQDLAALINQARRKALSWRITRYALLGIFRVVLYVHGVDKTDKVPGYLSHYNSIVSNYKPIL